MRPGSHGGIAIALLGILGRLVDMQGDHADGANPAGFSDDEALGAGGQGVGGGIGGIIGDGPDRFLGGGVANLPRQLKAPRGFSTR